MPSNQISESSPSLRPARVRMNVAAGETTPWLMVSAASTVVVKPGAGGSMSVQASFSPPSVIAGDNANGTSLASAVAWSSGSVTADTAEALSRATAVRFIAAAQPGIAEIAS